MQDEGCCTSLGHERLCVWTDRKVFYLSCMCLAGLITPGRITDNAADSFAFFVIKPEFKKGIYAPSITYQG